MKGEELRIVTCVRRRHYLHHHRRSYRCRRCCYAAAPPLLSTSPASATAPLAASVATATTITADVPCHVDRVHGAAITYALSSVVAVDVADAGQAAGDRWCCCAVWYVTCQMCWCWRCCCCLPPMLPPLRRCYRCRLADYVSISRRSNTYCVPCLLYNRSQLL